MANHTKTLTIAADRLDKRENPTKTRMVSLPLRTLAVIDSFYVQHVPGGFTLEELGKAREEWDRAIKRSQEEAADVKE